MARELARVEEDRAVMLAGISHDLRTPLARLRLETEMSVDDDEAKRNMAMDIDQLDAIIDKFMDYARPWRNAAPACARGAADRPRSRAVPRPDTDPHHLARGHRPGSDGRRDRARPRLPEPVRKRAPLWPWHLHRRGRRDRELREDRALGHHQRARPRPRRGADKLPQLATPFFRGDAARTAATGAGLGLAIVDKAMQRMGGSLEMANAPDGGLIAHLRLQRAA
jgi:two-component system osmolarity sensor histidine kinase EnvZ